MKILLVLVTVICSSTADIMGGHGIGKTFNNNVEIKMAWIVILIDLSRWCLILLSKVIFCLIF